MLKIFSVVLALPLSSAVLPALASGTMKPGLWEMTMKSDAMKNMPQIPPAQLEQMKKMGIDIPAMQDSAMVSKVCVTREMTERDSAPGLDQKELGCQSKNYRRSGNTYSVDIVCNGKDMKGEGKVKGTYLGSESFTSVYDFKGVLHGQPVSQRQETSGKWLSADCGNVKPVGNPK